MGFFSQDCQRCGHPALSPYAVNAENRWMNEVVVVTPTSLHLGTYDGYGHLYEVVGEDDDDILIGADNTVYHRSCWVVEGRPERYLGASHRSEDQGWFFEPGAHHVPDPLGAAERVRHPETRGLEL